jgi:serine/threonine-protein kinase
MPTETTLLPERYREPRLVARGGMGEVYRATDTSLGRPVAVKLLDVRHAADETVRLRFTREAHAAARLSGEAGIVTIFDVGEWNGRPFIVMEYLSGGSLQEALRREGAQPPARALAWLEQAGRALDHAHGRGVVHRDVKPANLLLDGDGRVHVADFGVATAAGLATLTQTGTVIGTAGYLSPEQAEGRVATPASDRYALGVVAFELLTGIRPYANDNPTAEAAAHVTAPVPSISRVARWVPRQADAVFERALAKDPARRFASCGALVAALHEAFADEAGATRVLAAPSRERRRPPLLPLALALLLAGAAVAAVVATRGGGTAAAPPTAASRTQTQTRTAARTVRAPRLGGDGSLAAAYSDYDLAVALYETQGCSDRVLHLLSVAQAIVGRQPAIGDLRSRCTAPAPPPHGEGRGRGKGHGHGGGD